MREEEGGGAYTVAAKVRGQGPLGGGGGSNRHRVVGGARQNDPLLTVSKEEETMAMARLDGMAAEEDKVGRDDRDWKGGIVDHTRKRVAVPT